MSEKYDGELLGKEIDRINNLLEKEANKPTTNKIKKGSFVKWNHKVSLSSGLKDFVAEGKVLNIKKSRVGGTNNIVEVACIELMPNAYWQRIRRKTTTISLSKLSLIDYI